VAGRRGKQFGEAGGRKQQEAKERDVIIDIPQGEADQRCLLHDSRVPRTRGGMCLPLLEYTRRYPLLIALSTLCILILFLWRHAPAMPQC